MAEIQEWIESHFWFFHVARIILQDFEAFAGFWDNSAGDFRIELVYILIQGILPMPFGLMMASSAPVKILGNLFTTCLHRPSTEKIRRSELCDQSGVSPWIFQRLLSTWISSYPHRWLRDSPKDGCGHYGKLSIRPIMQSDCLCKVTCHILQ